MVNYVIALEPEKRLYNLINNLKSRAKKLVGNQLYLKDEPHLTLYLGEFSSIDIWENEFIKMVKSFKDYLITLNIMDWLVFKNDQVTGGNTLACKILDENQQLLILQNKVVMTMNKFRDQKLTKRYLSIYGNSECLIKENLNKYGFPFVGESWIPHFGIASFNPDSFDVVWNNLKNKCPQGFYTASSINIYELNPDTNGLTLIRKYKLTDV